MIIYSKKFDMEEMIPQEFTCEGSDVNPELIIEEVPQNTASMVLMVEDPDSKGGNFLHWLVYDMPVVDVIEEDSVPGNEGINDFGRMGWGGPCPSSGIHRYIFRLHALDKKLSLEPGKRREEVERSMAGHILATAEYIGLYKMTAGLNY
jgi:Raf kinase inhibitor-like YbhB/YbcL family protein